VLLTRRLTDSGPRWAADDGLLVPDFSLRTALQLRRASIVPAIESLSTGEPATGPLLAPIEPNQEVWAAGVTYLKSREARVAESEASKDVYERVYDADRPELFPKAIGWRVSGSSQPIRVRSDADWTVPEPELTVVINRHLEVVGYCVGNDVSSRDIEGANPLYLPQAKIYGGSCAIGPGIAVADPGDLTSVTIELEIRRDGAVLYRDSTSTSEMKRSPQELAEWLGRELTFPHGVFLMTGTSLVPPDEYSLRAGDEVTVRVGDLELVNPVRD
jgi:2-dehydro-3-deoxy-D-arabinonate dehydratase